ncbi:MAG: MogA/MoaB family molybdenum cofactor biosynthesis protein [Alkalinema sp. RU_4_3]|nr:MogA/MoaB family molybdenum cofactor biosynthesis protein [Alkalinema sp. RU_4_3]
MQPHPDPTPVALACAIVTVSDSRTLETDTSGQLIRSLLATAGHQVSHYEILPDEPERIRQAIAQLSSQPIDILLFNGGTGIAPRDTTYDAITSLLEKTLPGFGELFRMLSFAEVGSRAMASRAVAGTIGRQVLFSMPGSSKAVKLAMEQLVLPEMVHLVKQLSS